MEQEQKIKIWQWLEKQKYQTSYEETGEYRVYFDLDMPKILEDYFKWKTEKLQEDLKLSHE